MKVEVRASHEKLMVVMKAGHKELMAIMETNQEKMMAKLDAHHERIMARMDYQLEKIDTTVMEASREKSEAIVEQQDVPKEGAAVETIGALEDRYGDWHLVIGRR
jgi:predicted dinucleotide-utilizing enzyme